MFRAVVYRAGTLDFRPLVLGECALTSVVVGDRGSRGSRITSFVPLYPLLCPQNPSRDSVPLTRELRKRRG